MHIKVKKDSRSIRLPLCILDIDSGHVAGQEANQLPDDSAEHIAEAPAVEVIIHAGSQNNGFGIFPKLEAFEQNEHMPCKLDIALCVRVDTVICQKLGVVRNDRARVEYNDIVMLRGELVEHSVYTRNCLDKRNMSETLPRAVDIVEYQRRIGIYLADERIDSIQIVVDAVGYLIELLVVCSEQRAYGYPDDILAREVVVRADADIYNIRPRDALAEFVNGLDLSDKILRIVCDLSEVAVIVAVGIGDYLTVSRVFFVLNAEAFGYRIAEHEKVELAAVLRCGKGETLERRRYHNDAEQNRRNLSEFFHFYHPQRKA